MKHSKRTLKAIIGFGLFIGTVTALGQGTFEGVFGFGNDAPIAGGRTPIYGPDPGNPFSQKWGNPTNAVPPGTQIYFGPPLAGSNYSVQAWYTTNAISDPFQLIPDARAVSGSLGTFGSSGYFTIGSATIPDALVNPAFDPNYFAFTNEPFFAYIQVRAWDNEGGQLTTWDAAWNAALAGSGRAVGWSKVFWQPLTYPADTKPWPAMPYFESFNTFFIPEPSLAGLILAGGPLLAVVFRRIKRSG